MGAGRFAVPSLLALKQSHELLAVVTQPDRPSGRGRHVSESPVKQEAAPLGVPIYQPERVRDEAFVDTVKRMRRLDAIVVAAYGQIIPKSILDLPRLGAVNVHASLLPRYRGAAPIQHALIQGETETGVTIMLMDPGLDTGPILLQQTTEIGPAETAGELEARLAQIGAGALLCALDGLEQGAIQPTPQDDPAATLAHSIKREEAAMDWGLPAAQIVNRVRAFNPKPGAYTHLHGDEVRTWRASVAAGAGPPGSVIEVRREGVLVAAGRDAVLLTEVQPQDRRRMTAGDFARGAHLRPGDTFN